MNQASVGLVLWVVEKPNSLRFKTGFGKISVGDDRFNVDPHDARGSVNPPFNLQLPALQSHDITPSKKSTVTISAGQSR
jgi:hypothetical protein